MTTTAALIAYHGHDHGWIGPWFLFLWLVPLAFVLAFWRRGWRRRWGPENEAAATLATRYARGEIDEDEFRQRRDVLRREG